LGWAGGIATPAALTSAAALLDDLFEHPVVILELGLGSIRKKLRWPRGQMPQ
jgi:hypothetical protein